MATNTNNVGTPGIPDPETIQTPGISDAAKRKIFFAVVGLLVVVILANVFSPNTPPKNPVTAREQKHTAQTPTVQQVNDLKKSIDDSTRILQENLDRDNEVASQRNQQKQTLAELQAADALRDAQQQRAISKQRTVWRVRLGMRVNRHSCNTPSWLTNRSLPTIA